MSIAAEPFSSIGHFLTYRREPRREGVSLFILECAGCGYEPKSLPQFCPRCYGITFQRTYRPGSILREADSRRVLAIDPADTVIPHGTFRGKKLSDIPVAHLDRALLSPKMPTRLRADIEAYLATVGAGENGGDDEDSED